MPNCSQSNQNEPISQYRRHSRNFNRGNHQLLCYQHPNHLCVINEFSWSDLTGKTNVTTVYPVYPDLDYVQENLYKNNSLEDILYVKDEFPAGNSIHLQFKHLFSLLTLYLDRDLQTNLQKIEITCPAVSSIIPKSAEIVPADNETHTTTIAQVSPSGNYSFIVPPVKTWSSP